MKLEVHTLRYGNADWLQVCAKTLDGYCRRHGLDLRVWNNDVPREYPTAKFAVIDMLKAFLAGSAEWMLFMDADVFVHPHAPLPDMLDKPGFHAVTDVPHAEWIPRWRQWCGEQFGITPDVRFIYRNSGVWLCDRAAAEAVLTQVRPPFVSKTQEQHQFNLWLWQASEAGMPLHFMDWRWNRLSYFMQPAWFFHANGKDKFTYIKKLVNSGLIPHPPEQFKQPPPPTQERAIVYPWKSFKAKWKELQYSLRSVAKHFADKDCPIYILGTEMPSFLRPGGRIKYLDCWLYAEAIVTGTQLAKEVLWMNDDIVMLKDCGWDDFRQPRHMGRLSEDTAKEMFHNGRNTWAKGLGRVVLSLMAGGKREVLNYSTHIPYVYEADKVIEVLKQYGVWEKMPLETAYHNHFDAQAVPVTGFKSKGIPAGDETVMNYIDSILDEGLVEFLQGRFPDPQPWELAKSARFA